MSVVEDIREVHLYFNRLISKNYLTGSIEYSLSILERKVISCTSWDDLSEKLKLKPKSICFHYSELEHCTALEIVNMVNTLCKLVGIDYKMSITVGVGKTAEYRLIKELEKSEIFGLIPAWIDFGIDETVAALKMQWSEVSYWPKHITEQLPGYKVKKPKDQSIELTSRQEQIFRLITRTGVSNKNIARTLNIAESTVKLHLSNIFKKFGVKNRTQLVSFNKKSTGINNEPKS